MTIHSLPENEAPHRGYQDRPDTTAYDSTWTEQPPTQPPDQLEQIMMADGKIYVVLAVVLLIWFGLLTLLVRTDRKIDRLERRLDRDRSDDDT